MELTDILAQPYTAEEFLSHQRKIHKSVCEKEYAEVMKKATDKEYIEELKATAAHIMKNEMILPGSGGKYMDIGTPPAWNERRTDDNEYLWHLNRMGYHPSLVSLTLLTGDASYAKKVVADMENWIDTCPVPPLADSVQREDCRVFCGVSPWRSLEVGLRLCSSWNTIYDRLLPTEFMTPEFHAKFAVSMYEHARVLRIVSPLLWPNANHNHYLSEMSGLLNAALRFPDMKGADEWLSFSVRELERCAANQFSKEGGQIEGCPGYHNVTICEYLGILRTMRAFGTPIPLSFGDLCRRAAVYSAYSLGPDGKYASFGDTSITSSGERVTTGYYRVFGELGATESALPVITLPIDTDVVPADVQKEGKKRALTLPPSDHFEPSLGQYFARTGWSPEDSYFAMICHSPVQNGHAHQDVMSFVLYLDGDPVVVDPSYYAYRECPERVECKSPEFHSCLTFDNKPPFEYISQWSFSPQKEGKIYKTYHAGDVFAADASHENYAPDEHRRLCALVGKDVFFVADDVKNVRGTDVRLYFHVDDPTLTVRGREASSERIRILLPKGVTAEAVDSYKSPYTDLKQPTRRLILTDKLHGERALYLTVFTKRADVTDAAVSRGADGIEISFTENGKTRKFVWRFAESLQES